MNTSKATIENYQLAIIYLGDDKVDWLHEIFGDEKISTALLKRLKDEDKIGAEINRLLEANFTPSQISRKMKINRMKVWRYVTQPKQQKKFLRSNK